MIGIAIRFNIQVFLIRHHHTTFGAGDRFYKIKRKSSGIADRTQ